MNGGYVFSKWILALSLFLSSSAQADDVRIFPLTGEDVRLELDPQETFGSVLETVCSVADLENCETVRLEVSFEKGVPVTISCLLPKGSSRDYYAPLTASEKKDLTYIVKTLANNSLAKIAKEKSSLKKAGDRLDNLHPFKFMEAIFSDDELKVCVRNIEGKSWIWTEFRDGITSSLAKESAVNNLKSEYIYSFAEIIHIDPNAIISTIQEKNWNKLVIDVISLVPRNGGADRYDM